MAFRSGKGRPAALLQAALRDARYSARERRWVPCAAAMKFLVMLALLTACASGSGAPQRDSSPVLPPPSPSGRALPEADTRDVAPADGAAMPELASAPATAPANASTSTSVGSPSNGRIEG